MKCLLSLIMGVSLIWANGEDIYRSASLKYVKGQMDQALLELDKGLQNYPDNRKLQMLKERIEETKEDQQEEQEERGDSGENQDNQQSPENQEEQQDETQDQDNQENDSQDQGGNSSAGASSQSQSSSTNTSADSQENQGQGQSSSSQAQEQEQQENQQPSPGEEGENSPQDIPESEAMEMSPEQAQQLLESFSEEEQAEEKPWRPARGQTRPAKDW